MKISIITPAFGQLDWLRMCFASVADQIAPEVQGAESRVESRESRAALEAGKIANPSLENVKAEGGDTHATQKLEAGSWELERESQFPISNLQSPAQSPLAVEHIIQDGGTPGIEDFAREVGAEFYRDGKLVFGSRPSALDPRLYRLAIYSEADAGMYDALNKGIARMSGDLWAWLNCDEQYLPGTLAYVAGWFAAHPAVDILCGDALLTDEEGRAVSYRRIVKPELLHTRLVHLASASCSSFYRRSIVERGGLFDTQWRSIGDAEWMARMLKAGVAVKACGIALSSFAFTGINTSESPLAVQESARWQSMPDAPPSWLKRPVVLLYRIRKMLAGAYSKRSLTYSLHGMDGSGRVTRRAGNLGWGWGGTKC